MLIEYIITLLLSIAPVSEARGAIIYGSAAGLNIYLVLILSILVNILVAPLVFLILKKARFRDFANKVMGQRISGIIQKNKEKFENYQEFALMLFVAVPLPGTGAWTGAILASALNLDDKKSFVAISLGVVIAAIIIFLGVVGVTALAKFI